MRERFEAIAEACARSASLDGSFSAPAQAAADGHSSSSPEAKARARGIFSPSKIPLHCLAKDLAWVCHLLESRKQLDGSVCVP